MVTPISVSTIAKFPWIALKQSFKGYCLYALIDQAFANLLALKTLRHGTGAQNWWGIQTRGADPECGNNGTGSVETLGTHFTRDQCLRRFYVTRDQANEEEMIAGLRQMIEDKQWVGELRIWHYLSPERAGKIIARTHLFGKLWASRPAAVLSGEASLRNRSAPWIVQAVQRTLGGALGFFTPTVKFRFDPDDMGQFHNAYLEPGVAYYTERPIGCEHMGISGSLIQGWKWKHNWGKRIQEKPWDPAVGALQLFLAIGLTAKLLSVHQKLKVYSFLDSENFFVKNGVRLIHLTAC